MRKNILWDLDGTLTDPRQGIIRCFQYALEKAGHSAPVENEILWVIGPPIQKSFSKLVPQATEIEVWDLVEKYRERFTETGMFENIVYDGIPSLLASLSEKRMFLATSKPLHFAKSIVSHFNLTKYFNGLYGSERDGRRSDKGELIEHILRNENILPADAIIIGDREHDILGAKKAGIASIGITWGYGSRSELEKAGADVICETPLDLQEILLR